MGRGPPSPLRKRILKLMKFEGHQTVNDLVVKLGISNGSSRSVLVKMRESGLIKRIGPGKYHIEL